MDKVETKPCEVCGGSGWSPHAKGTGYDDVCDNCIAGEVLDEGTPEEWEAKNKSAPTSAGIDLIRQYLRETNQDTI